MMIQKLLDFSVDIQYVYKKIDEYNIDKERKILIVFDDLIAYMINSINNIAKFNINWIVC